jgi:hypothetical protein
MLTIVNSVPHELRLIIYGNLDEESWIKHYLYNPEFAKFASSDYGQRMFIALFTVNNEGTRLFGKLQSIYDKPAVIWRHGTQFWYHRGELHRGNNQPAIICADGLQKWYQHGVFVFHYTALRAIN